MAFMDLLNQAMTLFILLIIGFVVRKLGIINDDHNKGLSNLIIKVTLPLLIITSMNYEFNQEMFNNSILILIGGAATYIFMIIIATVFTKIFHTDEPQRGVYKFLIIFSNTGFMGYPILNALYGEVGIFYGAVFNLLFNIMLWTLGIILVTPSLEGEQSDSNSKKSVINLRTLANPGILSVIIGFLLFIFSIKIPTILYAPLKLLGDTTTPLAMLIVGAMLGDAKFKEMMGNYKLLVVTAIRLIIIPVAILLALPIFNLPDIVTATLVIVCGMPSAANSAIFARIYDSDYNLASQGVFVTTLFSVISIPLLMLFITT